MSVAAPTRARDGVKQLTLGLLIFAGYLAVTHLAPRDVGAANARGRGILRFEHGLGVDIERAADHWLGRAPSWLSALAAWEYAITYIVTTFVVLGWIWWRRPADYRWARNTLIWTTVIAVAVFALWPVAPPRLLPGAGFRDIVAMHHPALSWGGGTVSAGADQYAAMPSLHIGWAGWVTVVTLRARATRVGYGLAVLHLAVTAVVVVATANHYVVDVVAGGLLVAVALLVERWRAAVARRWWPGERVGAPDEFFLHVETPTAQQPVGGFVILDRAAVGSLGLHDFKMLLAERLHRMPRLQQRLRPAGWLRHTRWVDAEVDLDWHVREHPLPGTGSRAALATFVSRLTEQRLDRTRPLWQVWFVPDIGNGECAAIGIMHHVVADGLGVVDILRQLFEPELPPPDLSKIRRPPWFVRGAGAASGLAHLAREGQADRLPFVLPLSGLRRYGFAATPLEPVRELARRTGTRVTDVLLTAVGTAVGDSLRARGCYTTGRTLRAAVPVTTRIPVPPGAGRRAEAGNRTAALRLDVPIGKMAPLQRLRMVHAAAEPRRRSGRGLAAALVMRCLGLLPPAAHRWCARAIYNGRYLNAIVSNMPGPAVQLTMAGAPIRDTYPIVPLADRVPLGIGTLGWNGMLCLSVITDPDVLPETDVLLARIIEVIGEMHAAAGQQPAVVDAQLSDAGNS